MNRFVIAAYVENKYGVLTRVSGLFMRKGFNIDSLTVGETDDPAYSRITITHRGDDYAKEQLINQLKKLYNVKNVVLLEHDKTVERELMLVKVKNSPENRSEVMAAAQVYRAKIIDYNPKTLCVEVTGEPSKIDAFIEVVKPLGIIEMCRTGVVALERNRSITE
ncbi:MAG TPA: acetolactate synthase small subunit [Candidatus Ruthenibacterium merdavium]|uniref:Acetolactate synthase small subunit n=2 Tax=Ruthenibacterium TaxID=1905344 RepID=A0A9D2M3X5_9FIRM|nr:acetolactate synthase small subunit [Candidatus Ruthenibacterium avium]HJC73296.1 acetolactate synthase small subunit [Candidatus Ruthenibacterium merdavium]